MKNLSLLLVLFLLSTVASNGQLSPGASPLDFTFYKPQPGITILKGVSSPASHPDFDWFEPETFTPSTGTGYEYPSYRVFSLGGAIMKSNVEILSISTDGLSERKIGTILQNEVIKGLRVSTVQNLKPISFPLSGVKDLKFYVGIPGDIAKKSLGMVINLRAKIRIDGKTIKEVNLRLEISPGGGDPGI
jgi:hypothetical protein